MNEISNDCAYNRKYFTNLITHTRIQKGTIACICTEWVIKVVKNDKGIEIEIEREHTHIVHKLISSYCQLSFKNTFSSYLYNGLFVSFVSSNQQTIEMSFIVWCIFMGPTKNGIYGKRTPVWHITIILRIFGHSHTYNTTPSNIITVFWYVVRKSENKRKN